MTDPAIITISLRLPSPELHPNKRPHHFAKARAKKRDRQTACYVALEAMRGQKFGWSAATTRVIFNVKKKNDNDNLSAWLKAYWDGFVDAGLLANDDKLTHQPITQIVGKTTGVSITISKGTS